MKFNRLIQSIALAGLGSTIALAQENNAPRTDEDPQVERIRVTGSSIKRTSIEGDLPLTVFSRADIDAAGITSAEQLMMQLNIAGNASDNLASNAGIVSAEQRGNNGVSGANLRGQGSDATLVLLNGRRVATHGLKGRAVDLNSIPFAALERVEVLRDGASAVYGTDAIGGVINFITKRDYSGGQVSAFADVTEAGGANIYRTNLLFGTGDLNSDGWNVFGTLSYKRNTALRGDQRDFSSTFQPERGLSPDTRGTPFATVFPSGLGPNLIGTGLTDPVTGGNMNGGINILNLPGGNGCANGGDNMGPYDFRLWNVASARYSCAWDYPAAQAIQQPQESLDFLGRASFKLAEQHEMYVELAASEVDVKKSFEHYQISPSNTFRPASWYPSTGEMYNTIFFALQDYFGPDRLNYGEPIAYRWRCIECGFREIETNTSSYRLLVSFEGIINDWDYNVGVSRAQNESVSELGGGYYYTDGLVAALGGGNINPFLAPGREQSAQGKADLQAASARGVKLYGGRSLMTQLDASLSGELGFELNGGVIQAAVGVDLRREEFEFNGDTRDAQRAVFLAPFDNANALDNVKRDIKAIYSEVYLPVLDNLDVTLAVRRDQYSGFGGTTNPKISFKFQPIDGLLFRGAYNTGFKVPSFNQLFNGEQDLAYTGLDLADPATCPGAQANESIPGCERIQPTERFGGKADLKPEESTQKSFGVVWAGMDNFNISLDWWEVERTSTIRSAPRNVLIEYYDLFQANWIRDANGNVVTIDRRFINSGGTLTRGIELDANLRGKLADGDWRINLNGSYIDTFKTKGVEDLPYSDNLVGDYVRFFNLPIKWKHTLNFSYTKGDWAHSFSQIYRHGYKDELPVSVRLGTYVPAEWNPRVDNYITYNYSATYSGLENMKFTLGVKNIFDQNPPFTAHQNDFASGAGWETRIGDPRGRAFSLLFEYNFM
ncbi:TonB-dependent receptor domain-containing protein [Arsukibacterium sp.]|uniref:TonB-dependent receptor domain-containing protein n=1 Tax=Arsukibacterium sp. TaxID=1977258 RepID=UPI002FD9041C